MLEYEEVLKDKYSLNVASNFITALKELPNVNFIHIFFRWNLLTDVDDNKFVDCAIAANADCIVTHDKDFNILKKVNFPKVNVVTIQEFEKVAKQWNTYGGLCYHHSELFVIGNIWSDNKGFLVF